jgi:hypothetical protein
MPTITKNGAAGEAANGGARPEPQADLFDLPPMSATEAIYRECRAILGRPATLAELKRVHWPSRWVKPSTKPARFTTIARRVARAIEANRLPPDPDCDDTYLYGVEATAELWALICEALGGKPTRAELVAVNRQAAASIALLDVGCPCGRDRHLERRDAIRQRAGAIARAIVRLRKRKQGVNG